MPKLANTALKVTTEPAQPYAPKTSTGRRRARIIERTKPVAIRTTLASAFHPMEFTVRWAKLGFCFKTSTSLYELLTKRGYSACASSKITSLQKQSSFSLLRPHKTPDPYTAPYADHTLRDPDRRARRPYLTRPRQVSRPDRAGSGHPDK